MALESKDLRGVECWMIYLVFKMTRTSIICALMCAPYTFTDPFQSSLSWQNTTDPQTTLNPEFRRVVWHLRIIGSNLPFCSHLALVDVKHMGANYSDYKSNNTAKNKHLFCVYYSMVCMMAMCLHLFLFISVTNTDTEMQSPSLHVKDSKCEVMCKSLHNVCVSWQLKEDTQHCH